jgi:hypothetical protein
MSVEIQLSEKEAARGNPTNIAIPRTVGGSGSEVDDGGSSRVPRKALKYDSGSFFIFQKVTFR